MGGFSAHLELVVSLVYGRGDEQQNRQTAEHQASSNQIHSKPPPFAEIVQFDLTAAWCAMQEEEVTIPDEVESAPM